MLIKVKVFASSDRDEIVESEGQLKAYVKSKAENNKANTALIKLLCKRFDVNYKKIKIKNPKSKEKIIEIDI